MPEVVTSIVDVRKKIPTHREMKKKELRKAIYEAAIQLFLERGCDNVTIEDITQLIHIAKGTFFNYFPSKESVLLSFPRRHLDEVIEEIIREAKQFTFAQEKLHHLFSLLVNYIVVNETIVKWVLIESLKMRGYQRERKGGFKGILQSMADTVEEGQERGEFKKDMNPEKIVRIMESLFFFAPIRWLTFNRHTP